MADFSLACMATELARAISAAETVTDHAVKVPIAKATKIVVADGAAVFIATNGEQTTRVSIAAQGDGVVYLDTGAFAAKVRALRKDKPVEVTGNEKSVTVTQVRTRWKVPAIANTGLDYEARAEPLTGPEFNIDADQFLAALRAVQPAFATDERYHMGGAHVEIVGGEMRVVATDAHLLHAVEVPGKFPAFEPMLVPPEAIAAMGKLFAEAGQVRVIATADAFTVHADDVLFRSRLIEAKFPDWRRAIPSALAARVIVDGPDLIAAIERAGTIAEDHNNKNGAFIRTVLSIRESEVEVATANKIGEEGNDFCACERQDGDDLEVPVSASLLLKALRSFGEIDTLTVEVGKPAKVIMLRRTASAGDDFRLVMPLIG